MKRLTSFFSLFLFLSFTFLNLSAQTNKTVLTQLAAEKAKLFEQKKAEAIEYARENNIPVKFVKSDGVEMELMYIRDGKPIYYSTDNVNAAATVSTDKVWEEGAAGLSLSGEGVTLGIWDGGKTRTTHTEFEGRAIPSDNATSTSDHATHVSGTVGAAGINPIAKGMSYNATLHTRDWNNDESEMANAAADGLVASNHSYGVPHGWESDYRNDGRWAWLGDVNISPVEDWEFGYYSSQTRFWDQIAYNAPNYLICRSAGNERSETGPGAGGEHWVLINNTWTLSTDTRQTDGPYDCIQTDKIGKNIMTVGAVNDIPEGFASSDDVTMSSFSSWGPADDGRVKPDIVANGVNLTSTSHNGDNSYNGKSGTSMSTPNVTGSIGLIHEHWRNSMPAYPPTAATVKGLIIHTADEAGNNPGPDYVFGWGLLNTYKAVNLISYDAATGYNNFIRELEITQGQTITIEVESNGNSPVTATICWTDYPGTPVAPALDPRDPMLVNDLDLRVTDPSQLTYEPWKLDPDNPGNAAVKGDNIVDNVEKVEVESTQSGTYTIIVTHKGTLTDGPQKFSLLISGIAMDAPSTTSLTYPENGAVDIDLEPVLKWERVETAESYQLEIATDTTFSNVISFVDEIPVVQYLAEELPDLTKIFWRVRAYNNGGYSDWSEINSFETVIGIPTTPILIYPEDELAGVTTNTEISWASVPRADRYQLQLGDNSLLFSTLVDVDTLTDTTYTVEGLEDGERYFWRVYAINEAGKSDAVKYRFYTEVYSPDSLEVISDSSGNVTFAWADMSSNEDEYVVERKISVDADFIAIDSLDANSEQYTDTEMLEAGMVEYRVYCYNDYGTSEYSTVVNVDVLTGLDENSTLPQEFELGQNYPNPFNPTTSINFALPENASVTLEVFNVLGQKVGELINSAEYSAGIHKVEFFASSFTSGVYLYRLTAVGENNEVFSSTRKMMILK